MKNAHKITIVWCVLAALRVAVGAEVHNDSANASGTIDFPIRKTHPSPRALKAESSAELNVRIMVAAWTKLSQINSASEILTAWSTKAKPPVPDFHSRQWPFQRNGGESGDLKANYL
jgi:hypothetical protein